MVQSNICSYCASCVSIYLKVPILTYVLLFFCVLSTAVETSSPTHSAFMETPRHRPGTGNRNRQPEGTGCNARMKTRSRTSFSMYFLVCLFGMSSSLPTTALWTQLPNLVKNVPEEDGLSRYLIVILEMTHLLTIVYLLVRKCARGRLNEVPFLYSVLALGSLGLLLPAALWDHVIQLWGQERSLVLLLSAFLGGTVTCVATVTMLPFTWHLKQAYVTAVLLGDSLGSLVPHVLVLAQGIGPRPLCPGHSTTVAYPEPLPPTPPSAAANGSDPWQTGKESRKPEVNFLVQLSGYASATPPSMVYPDQRFSMNVYFFACAGVFSLSIVSFLLIRWCKPCIHEYSFPAVEGMDEIEMIVGPDDGMKDTGGDGIRMTNPDSTTIILDDGTIYQGSGKIQRSNNPGYIKTSDLDASATPHARRLLNNKTQSSQRTNISGALNPSRGVRFTSTTSSTTSGKADDSCCFNPDHPRHFVLLLLITFWGVYVTTGPLSSDKSYACFPTGNMAFQIGAIVTDVASIIACLVAARFSSPKQQISTTLALSCLGTILLTYFVALMAFSHESESRHQSPIYGDVGEFLTVSVNLENPGYTDQW